MQVRALMEAALDRAKAGGKPVVEIMIPLTVTREEMEEASSWVTDAINQALKGSRRHLDVTIGTMIETPRAALVADEIAEVADTFQLRHQRPDADDLRLQPRRRRVTDDARLPGARAVAQQPFESIDEDGVDDLVNRSRSTRTVDQPQIKLGVCGELRRRPASIVFFQRRGSTTCRAPRSRCQWPGWRPPGHRGRGGPSR